MSIRRERNHPPTLYAVVDAESADEYRLDRKVPAGTRLFGSPVAAACVASRLNKLGREPVLMEAPISVLVEALGESAFVADMFAIDSPDFDAVGINKETARENWIASSAAVTDFRASLKVVGSALPAVGLPTNLLRFHKSEKDFDGVSVNADALGAIRSFLEPLWEEWQSAQLRVGDLRRANTVSTGLCRMATGFLIRYLDLPLSSFAMGEPGTSHDASGGFFAPEGFVHDDPREYGRWAHHTWAVVGGQIVDLTADQFDPSVPSVVVTSADDARYKDNLGGRTKWITWGDMQQMPILDRWMSLSETANLPSADDILPRRPTAMTP